MTNQVNLLHELIEKTERYLVPMGVWPSANNGWITIFNIVVLIGYSLLVLIKNLLNPEPESIENAFTLGNAGIIIVFYFVAIMVEKEKALKFFAYIKRSERVFMSAEADGLMIAGGKEYQKISTAFSYILSAMVLVRFIQPPLEYGYIKIFNVNKTLELPPSMGVPTVLFGEITTYIIESVIRMIIFSSLVGVCTIFIISTIQLCVQCNILAVEMRNFRDKEVKAIDKLVKSHEEILSYAKILNQLFSWYFFADCLFSFINLSMMMFSLLASNSNITNYLMEVPLVTCGMSQLFFVLYFGDRLIEATSQVSTAIYQSEWPSLPIKVQKKILFIIMRGQKLRTLNIGGNNGMVASMLLFSQASRMEIFSTEVKLLKFCGLTRRPKGRRMKVLASFIILTNYMFGVIGTVTAIIYMFRSKDVLDMAECLAPGISPIAHLICFACFHYRSQELFECIEELKLLNSKVRSIEHINIITDANKFSSMFTRHVNFAYMNVLISYITKPLVTILATYSINSKIVFETPVKADYLVDVSVSPNYEIVYIIQILLGCYVCFFVAASASTFGCFVCNLVAHYEILLDIIEDSQIDEFVKYHQQVIALSKKLSNLYRPIIFTTYNGIGIVLCVTGFQIIMYNDFIKIFAALVHGAVSIAYISIYSYAGQKILDSSSAVGKKCCKIDKNYLPIIAMSQKKMRIDGVLFDASMETLASLLSRTMSFITLLKSFVE